jgi:hypothetical protein
LNEASGQARLGWGETPGEGSGVREIVLPSGTVNAPQHAGGPVRPKPKSDTVEGPRVEGREHDREADTAEGVRGKRQEAEGVSGNLKTRKPKSRGAGRW